MGKFILQLQFKNTNTAPDSQNVLKDEVESFKCFKLIC